MSEEEFNRCMQEMAAGSRDALRRVYDAYLKMIYALIYNIVKHREAAEDITSEFFIRLYHAAPKFRGDGHHKAWICTIARNMCVDYMRKHNRELAVLDDDSREEKSKLNLRTERSDQEESIVNRLTMEKAMELLTEQEKSIVDLKLLGGLTFREISELLNMPMGTVTWHYNSGIKRLRRYLNHD